MLSFTDAENILTIKNQDCFNHITLNNIARVLIQLLLSKYRKKVRTAIEIARGKKEEQRGWGVVAVGAIRCFGAPGGGQPPTGT